MAESSLVPSVVWFSYLVMENSVSFAEKKPRVT